MSFPWVFHGFSRVSMTFSRVFWGLVLRTSGVFFFFFLFWALLKGIPGVVDATFFFTLVIFHPRLCRNSHFGPNSTAGAFEKICPKLHCVSFLKTTTCFPR